MKLTDCGECKGSGKVPLVGYRDNAAPEEDKMPKRSFSIPWRKLGILGAILGGICFISWGLPKACAADRRATYRSHAWGEILVEYDPHDGHPVKCFVQQGNTYTTNNPTRKISIGNRHDDGLIDDEAKMLDWPDGKTCHRFFYPELDEK